jgi:hypothetical protein
MRILARLILGLFSFFAWLVLVVMIAAVGRAAEPEKVVRPLTAVVVTQCNLVVVVYLTAPDGSLHRYDKSSGMPFEALLELAYSAEHSERVEVSCNSQGVVGFEGHRA